MRLLTPLLPLVAFLAPPALAQQPAPDRSGHYYLQGVMETGSELLLRPDGRFQWYLVYGALDLFAEGRWQENSGAIILSAEPTKDVPQPGFQTLRLTIRDSEFVRRTAMAPMSAPPMPQTDPVPFRPRRPVRYAAP